MDPFLITVSRVQSMRSFFNVVFRGRSALCGRDMVAGDANLDPWIRMHATYHNCSSSMLLRVGLRTSNERETPFPLYRGLRLHGHGRDKKQIGIDKDHRYRMLVSWK